MTPAVFSLQKYVFDKVSIDLSALSADMRLSLSIDPSGSYNQDTGEYVLVFIVEAFQDVEPSNKIVSVRCVASYKFQQPIPNEELPRMFYANSIAILFPYIRAFVSTVTLQANIVPPIILPTMNLTSLEERLMSNTKFQ